jgi:CheY-like chemotaxis protein
MREEQRERREKSSCGCALSLLRCRMPSALPVLLVVDDDESARELVAITLRRAGYDVIGAPDGARALDLIDGGLRPHLILLDLMMPVMSGWEFWDRRQVTDALRKIPVIVVTATGMTTGSIGEARVLSKPIDRAALRAAVAELVPLNSGTEPAPVAQ